jgi:hypothetical protein
MGRRRQSFSEGWGGQALTHVVLVLAPLATVLAIGALADRRRRREQIFQPGQEPPRPEPPEPEPEPPENEA